MQIMAMKFSKAAPIEAGCALSSTNSMDQPNKGSKPFGRASKKDLDSHGQGESLEGWSPLLGAYI